MSKDTLFEDLRSVNVFNSRVLGNLFVHEGLSEHRLIQLIVTHSSVSNNINNDIRAEYLSVLSSDLEHSANIIDAIGVNVENRSIDGFSNVSAVKPSSSVVRSSSETNLVVSYDMDGTSNSVVLKILHLHALVNNTLTSESSISMEDNRNNLGSVVVLIVMLFSSSSSHHNRVHAFKVGGVSKDRNSQLPSIFVALSVSCTKMVLNISRSDVGVLSGLRNSTLELSKNLFKRFLHNVREHIKSSSVRHTHNNFFGAHFRKRVTAEFKARDKSFKTF